MLPDLKLYYREHIAEFINDWGMTYDPRNVEVGLPAMIPFVLFDRQREFVDYVIRKWFAREPGLAEKSRDMGVSWLCVSVASSICLFYRGVTIGFGSRKEEYVDRIGEPKSLFFKARMFIETLPPEFRGGWDRLKNGPHMRLNFPLSESHITGEAGDNIGRGDRASIHFLDEAAYIERPQLVEAALSQTTNCQISVSSANGRANVFAEKRFSGKIEVFTFHWRQDPRKDQAWYDKQVAQLDPVTVAQEIDIDYSASIEGVLIPSAWVQSAIDVHLRFKFEPVGARRAALDVADEGVDLNAWVGGRGNLIESIVEWSGKGSTTFATAQRAFELTSDYGTDELRYDADGLGAFVRGDATVINENRRLASLKPIKVLAYRGSAAVEKPEGEDVKGRKNKDYFKNFNSQSWWHLRWRFQQTHLAVTEPGLHHVKYEDMISISSKIPLLAKLIVELSQVTYGLNTTGHVVINKKPEATKSPNLADGVKMWVAPLSRALDDAASWNRIAAMAG